MHTPMHVWTHSNYVGEGKLHSYVGPPQALFTLQCHPSLLSESFSKSYAAPLHSSLQCKLRRGILRGFLCGSQVKNWPACQIIISENERLNRIPRCSSLWTGRQSTKDTRFSLPLETGIWLQNIIFLLSLWGLKHMLLNSKYLSDFLRAALLWSFMKTTQKHSPGSFF